MMQSSNEYRYGKAKKRVTAIRSFYSHLSVYAVVIACLAALNFYTTDFLWFIFPALGWGIGLAIHGLCTFGYKVIFGRDWEERKIKELMESNEF